MSDDDTPRPRLGEQTALMCTLIAGAQLTWGVVVPVLPLLADDLTLSVATLGLVLSAFAVGRTLANIPAGLLLRRLHARRYLVTVAVALSAVTALTALAHELLWLIVLRVIAGILGGAAVTIGFAILVAGAPRERRGQVMALATVVQMSGAALGAVLGGFAVAWGGPAAAFLTAATPLLLVLGWDALRPAQHYWSAIRRSSTVASGTRSTVRVDAIMAIAALSFALFLARFAAEQGLVPVLAYRNAGLDSITLGGILAVSVLLGMAVLPVVGRMIDRGARWAILAPSTALTVTALLLLPLAEEPWGFGALVVLYGVTTSASNVLPGVFTTEAFSPAQAGLAVGVSRTAGDLGAAVGPALAFFVADRWGAAAAMTTISVVVLCGALVFGSALHRPRQGHAA